MITNIDIELVIWDFDGTILDTEWPTYAAALREFERYGVELDLAAWQDTLGSADHEPWWEPLRRAVGGFDESDDELLTRYRTYKNELTDAEELRPGVSALFGSLAKSGIPSALASSSPIEWVEKHTRRHELWDSFVGVATRTDVGAERTKPCPDLFLLAAERAGRNPECCLVIEDSHHGVVAAKAAGMRAIAVPHTLTETQDFTAADLVLESLEHLDLNALGFGS
ncbi:MAG: HAD superfamily hydrolase (TIGR01509 family) [Verrucomicrobiales bacterium]|jgi:HAD superfamily hydrolase (TIGR01509 family)